MPPELTDEEVFGPPRQPPPQGEMSDADVFGAPAQAPPPVEPTVSRPSVADFAIEAAKQLGLGAVGSLVSSRLKGLAMQMPDPILGTVFPPPAPTRPISEEPLYQAGEAVEKGAEKFLAPTGSLGKFGTDLTRALGSVGGNILGSVVPGGVATIPLQGMGEAAERAVQGKAAPGQQHTATALGVVSGATEFADALLPRLGSVGAAMGFLGRVGVRAALAAFIEGGQEGLQQLIQNAIEKHVYNPSRDYSHEVGYNALIGFIVGGGVGAIVPGGESPVAKQRIGPLDMPTRPIPGWEAPPAEPPVQPPPSQVTPGGPPTPQAGVASPAVSIEPSGAPPAAGPTSSKYTITDPLGARTDGETIEVTVLRDREGNVIAIDSDRGTTAVWPALRNLPPETIIAHMLGDHPQGAPPDVSKVRPVVVDETEGRGGGARVAPTEPVAPQAPQVPVEPPAAPPPVTPGAGLPPGVEYPAWALWNDIKDHDWQGAPSIPISPTEASYLRRKGVEVTPEGWLTRTGAQQLRTLAGDLEPGEVGTPVTPPTPPPVDLEQQPFVEPPQPGPLGLSGRPPGPRTVAPAAPVGGSLPIEPTEILPPQKPGVQNVHQLDPAVIDKVQRFYLPPGGRPKGTTAQGESPQTRQTKEAESLKKLLRGLGISKEEGPDLDLPVREGTDLEVTTIQGKPGFDPRLRRIVSQALYGDPETTQDITIKEGYQNAFDGIKPLIEQGKEVDGNIDVTINKAARTVTITDDGTGMLPETMGKEFLQIGGSKKETNRPSGNFGVAKAQFLYYNESLQVISMRDGKVAQMNTTGAALSDASDGTGPQPDINVRLPTEADKRLFPRGHGTQIKVKIPATYVHENTGETREIPFDNFTKYYPGDVIERSPLFSPINVTINGEKLTDDHFVGNLFPAGQFTPFIKLNFDWGSATVIVENETNPRVYYHNAHVLSNGVWQFSKKLSNEPGNPNSTTIPKNFYIDVDAKVSADQPGYPFQLDRQGFKGVAGKTFEKLFKYLEVMHSVSEAQESFGELEHLSYNPSTGRIQRSVKVRVEKKEPPKELVLFRPEQGTATIDVKEGKFYIEGKEIKALTSSDLEGYEQQVRKENLRVDPSTLNTTTPALHNVTEIEISPAETRMLPEYMREKYGERFDSYIYEISSKFIELRDVVAEATGNPEMRNYVTGVSFDPGYFGVQVEIPLPGFFINPIGTEFQDTISQAVAMTWTMTHELAHQRFRNHESAWRDEHKRINVELETHPTFNMHQFKQDIVNIIAAHQDVVDTLNGVFGGSAGGSVRVAGRGFERGGVEQARDGRRPDQGARVGLSGTGVGGVAAGGPAGEAASRPQPGPGNLSIQYSTRTTSDNGRSVNQRAIAAADGDSGVTAVGQQPELRAVRKAISRLYHGKVPTQVNAALGHADRMNKFFKWYAGLDQAVISNPRHVPLIDYREDARRMQNENGLALDAAGLVNKQWRRAGRDADVLPGFLEELTDMNYRSDVEKRANLIRHPSDLEWAKMVKDHGVTPDAAVLVDNIYASLHGRPATATEPARFGILQLIEEAIVDRMTRRGRTPKDIAAVRAEGQAIRARPYFPFIHFGEHYVLVKDPNGRVLHFDTYEGTAVPGSAQRQQLKDYHRLAKGFKDIYGRDPIPGTEIIYDILPESTRSLVGLPPMLVREMADALELTPEQINVAQMLTVAQMQGKTPVLGPQFQRKYYVPGYSMPKNKEWARQRAFDYHRAYIRYMFYASRYYVKIKYLDALETHVKRAESMRGNTERRVAEYMRDHFQNTVKDTKGDYAIPKGIAFTWAMAFSPAAASANLLQPALVAWPVLSNKFGGLGGLGDAKASAALIGAMGDLRITYRGREALKSRTDFEFRAMSYGVKAGFITEALAPEMAGLSQGGGLFKGLGSNRWQRGVINFQEKGAWLFEMTEQFARRVTFLASLRLAMRDPNSVAVKEARQFYRREITDLQAEGFSLPQAEAVATAGHMTSLTNFEYSRIMRPPMMRGRLAGTILIFWKFIQSLMMLLAQQPKSVLFRFAIMSILISGLRGLPGEEELNELVRAISKRLYGKDFNMEHEARRFLLQYIEQPDLIMHGAARRGMGFPALFDMLGGFITGQPGRGLQAPRHVFNPATGQMEKKGFGVNVPAPVFDISKSVSPKIFPMNVGALISPQVDPAKVFGEEAQRGLGAAFGVGFSIWKAIFHSNYEADDFKRWERAVPRQLAAMSRAWRTYSEGRERVKGGPAGGSTVINYDIRDTEQLMEIFGIALGYQPLRNTARWSEIIAQVDAEKFMDLTRTKLMAEMYEAVMGKRPEEIDEARTNIREFNLGLPVWARGKAITVEGLKRSMEGHVQSKLARESGVPLREGSRPIAREFQELFPEATHDVRKPAASAPYKFIPQGQ